ncbi:hypothetical protein G647_08197 [Cladophialophora carrionii CBS 160.54]|uniref:Integral membrane protein n=1 Tax=Cladophialophora carrionii CBS 160.54 TaxID=1279043 RepID=V9D1K3_9EURO|nr:uncharacterized protein G647_08197 [Cladophialophora carrionii CBS 160.54]ETI20163.1 hypothetical protein G647_08197 [Cladophialophora carrionii CBS 160.54]
MAIERRAPRVNVAPIKPMLRAYGLAYLFTTGPRIFAFLRKIRRSHLTFQEQVAALRNILITSLQLNRFPTAAAVLIGGATTFPRLVSAILRWTIVTLTRQNPLHLDKNGGLYLRASCSFLSAWLAFGLLNRDEDWTRKRAESRAAVVADNSTVHVANQRDLSLPSRRPSYAGKTIDFTAFAFCRALDIMVISAWSRTRARSWHPEQRTPWLANLLRKTADPSIFAMSAAVIMWSWFYAPERLPRAYNHWVSKAADIDPRLIQALRLARQGNFVYGEDRGQAPLLASLCRDLGLPEEYGDPARTIPIPCELYHCGSGKSCEVHALSRFCRSWEFAVEIYVPLQVLALLRAPSKRSILDGLRNAAISSSFLATFVASFYYAVCLARTRLGPKIVPYKTITPQMWDSGLCVLAGCIACGWSILLENPKRRQEIAFFAAPRALATLIPRVYEKRYQRREQVVFAASVAVVLTTLKSNRKQNVRGVLGRLLGGIMKE